MIRFNKLDTIKVLGMMSGTSGDGIDGACVEFCANSDYRLLWHQSYPFDKSVYQRIHSLMSSADARLVALGGEYVSALYAKAYSKFIGTGLIKPDLIAAHGQTIYHQPEPEIWDNISVSGSLQLLNGASLAEKTKTPVICNFRARDMALGGQGAPLVPFADRLFFAKGITKNRIILNVGGIANITIISADEGIVLSAFDTGPGNMLVDAMIKKITNGKDRYDKNGLLASRGKTNYELLNKLMADEYFSFPIPKSTGRERFGEFFFDNIYNEYKEIVDDKDFLSTLLDFTIESIFLGIQRAEDFFNQSFVPFELIIAGGGGFNKELLKRLEQKLPQFCYLKFSSDFGIPLEAREAMAFAALGWAWCKKINSSVRAVTGAQKEAILGEYHHYLD